MSRAKIPTQAQLEYMKLHENEEKTVGIIVATVILLSASSAAVSLRFLARRIGHVPLKYDDWLILLSLGFILIFGICYCLTTRYGLGRHAILVTDRKAIAIMALIIECSYTICLMCVKLSLLALHRRIFPMRWMKVTSHTIGFIVAGYTIAHDLSDIFQCVPVSAMWKPGSPATCLDINLQIMTLGIINMLTDITIFALPIAPFWGLNLPRARKWQLIAMFLVGGIVCIISIARLCFIKQFGSFDSTWDDINLLTLSLLENATAIVVACLPAWRPLFQHIREKA